MKKLTFKEARTLTLRAYKVWWNENPAIFISIFLHSLFLSSTPYIAIFFTARMIDEIAGPQNSLVLRNLVLMALISALLLGLLIAGFSRWRNIQMENLWRTEEKILGNKVLAMDFISVDDHRIRDLLSQIAQNTNLSNWGLVKIVYNFEQIVRGLISVSGALLLTITFFTATVSDDARLANLLNHPLFTLFIIALLVMGTFLISFLSNTAEARQVKFTKEMKFFNQVFFFINAMTDSAKQLDIRTYQQDKMAEGMMDIAASSGDELIKDIRHGLIGLLTILSAATSQLLIGIVYVFVGIKAWSGAFGIGAMTQYIGAITALSQSVSELFISIGELVNNAAFLQTTFEFLDEPNPMYHGDLMLEKSENNSYKVEFKNVSFKYPTVDTYALKNISMTFKIGERLAIVGENGSGKTTFIKLLCRLYDPTEGEILLNGIDIREYDYHEYINIFSVVFQDFKLLAFDLGENVAAGIDYDEALVRKCLEDAGFKDRLDSLEQGLKTRLYKDFDEKGINTSGGEEQKIALARALYKESAFIILDEPTAALDPIAEHEVYSRMNEMTEGKTAIFISHRLSSCRFCQDIMVFHQGEIVQQGSHDSLVADVGGKYHELWNAQAQYYVE